VPPKNLGAVAGERWPQGRDRERHPLHLASWAGRTSGASRPRCGTPPRSDRPSGRCLRSLIGRAPCPRSGALTPLSRGLWRFWARWQRARRHGLRPSCCWRPPRASLARSRPRGPTRAASQAGAHHGPLPGQGWVVMGRRYLAGAGHGFPVGLGVPRHGPACRLRPAELGWPKDRLS
jgi:hypothetical protein